MTQLAIDHLWQSTVFALVIGALTFAFRSNGAHIRFGLWLAASIKFLVPFALISQIGEHLQWLQVPSLPTEAAWVEALGNFAAPTDALGAPLGLLAPDVVSSRPPVDELWNAAAWFWSIWAAGIVVVIVWRTWQWLGLRAIVKAATPLPMTAPIQVVSSPAVLEPGLVGIVRPTLVLPHGISEKLTPQQLGAVLAHEFCHWRRRDNLTAAIHMLVETLFWFHPLVWWIERQLVAERERACDETVVTEGVSPRAYAESILAVCRFYVRSPLPYTAGMSGANLQLRIGRIVHNSSVRRLGRIKASALGVLAAATVIVPLGFGMTAPVEAMAQVATPLPVAVKIPTPRLAEPTVPKFLAAVSVPEVSPENQQTPVRNLPAQTTTSAAHTPQSISFPEPVKAQAAPERLQTPRTHLPTETEGLINRGKANFDERRFGDAIAAYSEALRRAPDNSDILFLRGHAYLGNKQDAEAIADYRQAIAVYDAVVASTPHDAEAFLKRGNISFFLATVQRKRADAIKSFDLALADYDTAIRLKSDFAVAYNNRGFAKAAVAVIRRSRPLDLQRSVADSALADLDAAIRIAPEFALAYYNRGNIWAGVGSRRRAQGDWKQAIRLFSDEVGEGWVAAGALAQTVVSTAGSDARETWLINARSAYTQDQDRNRAFFDFNAGPSYSPDNRTAAPPPPSQPPAPPPQGSGS